MNAGVSTFADFIQRARGTFRDETGQSLWLWALVALFSFLTQIVLFRQLNPGEFGTFNTVLGVVGLATVPLVAVSQALSWHVARDRGPEHKQRLDSLRAAAPVIVETFAWVWGVFAGVLFFVMLPLLELTRFSLHMFVILYALVAIGGVIGGIKCRQAGRLWLWTWLVVGSMVVKLILSVVLTKSYGWVEPALGAFLIAGLITLAPALWMGGVDELKRIKALRTAWDGIFLFELGAVFSVFLAIFLFSSADRIVAQSWLDSAVQTDIQFIDWPMFDAYQAAGLLGRAILWGTQPILVVLYIQRSRLDRTTATSLEWLWIYFVALFVGITLLEVFRIPLSELFCGTKYGLTAHLVPGFALTMIPLGILQGVAMFGLASRRYVECYVLGACSVAYLILLYLVGRHPQLMPAYMFGGGLMTLMIVLFVGIVRWGRKQP